MTLMSKKLVLDETDFKSFMYHTVDKVRKNDDRVELVCVT